MKEIAIYKSPDNKIEIQVSLENETVLFVSKKIG